MTYIILAADHCKIRMVRQRLRRKGYNAYVPALVIKRIVHKAGKIKRRRIVKPLMNYIIVEAPAPEVFGLWFHDVLTTDDVKGYLKSGDGPATLSLGALLELKVAVAKMRFAMEEARVRARLRKGSKVTIINGAGAGRKGTVSWLREERVKLEVFMFGAMRTVEVKRDDVAVVAA